MKQVEFYQIAGFGIQMNCVTAEMRNRLAEYRTNSVPEGEILDLCIPKHLYPEEQKNWARFEYNETFLAINRYLVEKQAFCFHASAISLEGQGILFSADSGTGKTTQALLWKRYLPDRKIVSLNDDKPIIRLTKNQPYAYGTPWSGKHNIDCNASAPIKALIFLEQSDENSVEKIPDNQVLPLVLRQVLGCRETPQELYELLQLLDLFIRRTAVYRLRCSISRQAVDTLYNVLRKDGVIK